MNKTVAMMIFNWAKSTFGDSAADPCERAIRNVEEAVEVAQTLGVDKDMVLRTVERTYSRPAGGILEELGGNLVTLLSLIYVTGNDPEAILYNEVYRITSRSPDVWKKKHDEKISDRTAISNPLNEVADALEKYAKEHKEKAFAVVNFDKKNEHLNKVDENKRLAEIVRNAIS